MRRLLLAGLLCVTSVAVADTPCFESWWQARLDDAYAKRGSASALLPLRQVDMMRHTAIDPSQIESRFEQIRAANGTDPLVAAELDAILSYADLGRGLTASAAARRARLGLVAQWLVAGPLTSGASSPIPALAQPGAAGWRRIDVAPLGMLPLDGLMTPAKNVHALAVVYLDVAATSEIALRFGNDDSVRVTVDNLMVFDAVGSAAVKHDIGFDQHVVFLKLEAGWHRVSFDVAQDDGAWGLTARFTAPDGTPLTSAVRAQIPDEAARLAAEASIVKARRPGVKQIERGRSLTLDLERAARGRDPLALAALALELSTRRLPARVDSRALTLVREAAQLAPRDLQVLWTQSAIETDGARRRQALESALEIAPADPAILRSLIHYHSAFGQDAATLAIARRALKACGGDDPYLVAWQAIARDGDGFPAGVIATLDSLTGRFPAQPIVWQQLAAYARREGFSTRAKHALRRYLALVATDDGARGDLVGLELEAGNLDEALRLIDAASALYPLSAQWSARRASLLQRAGRNSEALASADAALEISPGSPGLLVLRGEVLLALGRNEEAAAAFQSARPSLGEEGALDQRIAAITGEQTSFGGEWTVSLDDARAIEQRVPWQGDPAWIVLSQTSAWRVQADGRNEQFQQLIVRVRHPERADGAKVHSITYTPSLQRASVIEAKLIRADGTVIPGTRGEQPVLPDPELRMWYDSRALGVSFPRLEEGDLLDVRFAVSDRGTSNSIAEGYFGDMFVAGGEMPVLSTRFVIDAAAARPVKWKLVNLPSRESVSTQSRGDRQLTTIELPPLPAFQTAAMAPPAIERLPYAIFGTSTDWTTLGKQYARLIEDSTALDADIRDVVKQATAKTFSRRQIVRALYDWVIENTRYVALEFGINAVKPYSAPLVFKRRHGDCKDKATLLMAMLREAGIRAHVALVRTADRGRIDTTVPVLAVFDHAIVYVPGEDLWLDGTVIHHAMDELPFGDRGIQALVIDPQAGGTLTITSTGQATDALLARTEEIRLEPDGTATVSAEVVTKGDTAAQDRSMFRNRDQPGRTLQALLRRTWPELVLTTADFPKVGLDESEVRFSYRARVPRFGTVTGKRVEVPLSFAAPHVPLDPPSADRTLPLHLPDPFTQRTETTLLVPVGGRFTALPQPGLAESPWGRAQIQVRAESGRVRITAELSLKNGDVPPSEISALATFVEQARHLLQQRVTVEMP